MGQGNHSCPFPEEHMSPSKFKRLDEWNGKDQVEHCLPSFPSIRSIFLQGPRPQILGDDSVDSCALILIGSPISVQVYDVRAHCSPRWRIGMVMRWAVIGASPLLLTLSTGPYRTTLPLTGSMWERRRIV